LTTNMQAEQFTTEATDALAFLDELGGPDEPEIYAEVMRAVAAHCEAAAQRALLAHVGRDMDDTCPECERSYGPHYDGRCDHAGRA
jgi:hypothetical protein